LIEITRLLSRWLQRLGKDRALVATTLSSRPERSAVERSAVPLPVHVKPKSQAVGSVF
jgi:hypothetical protein